jgi:hypothetical protein
MISRSSEGGGSLPIVDYIGFMPIDLGAVNFDALPPPDISSEVRVPLCLPLFKPGAGSGESRGRPLGRSPDPRADSTVNPA